MPRCNFFSLYVALHPTRDGESLKYRMTNKKAGWANLLHRIAVDKPIQPASLLVTAQADARKGIA